MTAGQSNDRRKTVTWGQRLGGMPLKKEAVICQSMQELTPQDMFDSGGDQMKKTMAHMQRSLRSSLAKGGRIIHWFVWADSWHAFQWFGICCVGRWRHWPKGQFCICSELYSKHQGKATGDQIMSSKNTLLCMQSPSWTGDDCAWICSEDLQNDTWTGVQP